MKWLGEKARGNHTQGAKLSQAALGRPTRRVWVSASVTRSGVKRERHSRVFKSLLRRCPSRLKVLTLSSICPQKLLAHSKSFGDIYNRKSLSNSGAKLTAVLIPVYSTVVTGLLLLTLQVSSPLKSAHVSRRAEGAQQLSLIHI
eukprot:1792229-Amphidinium_carterae.3